jgi:hypothetical protein
MRLSHATFSDLVLVSCIEYTSSGFHGAEDGNSHESGATESGRTMKIERKYNLLIVLKGRGCTRKGKGSKF